MNAPQLSVILATSDDIASIAMTLRYLRAQSAAGRMEIVLVGPSEASLTAPPDTLEGFAAVQRVAIGPVTSIARANAAGVRAARAPVVALAEDHCFPGPGWAEALLEAHRGPWAAVGPVIRNANPATIISWCDFLIGYGPWMMPSTAGERPFLPGHNSSYKREVLLSYGERLEEAMESETVLHLDLARQGHRLYLEPRATAAHTNFAVASSWFPVQYHAGRVFGAARAAGWPRTRRLFYGAASPLIPLVRLARCVRELLRPGRPASLIPRLAPMLTLGLALDGLGQMAGYLFGFGDSVAAVARYEFHRFRHIPDSDRRELERIAPP